MILGSLPLFHIFPTKKIDLPCFVHPHLLKLFIHGFHPGESSKVAVIRDCIHSVVEAELGVLMDANATLALKAF